MGIGGVGMSGIAEVLHNLGYQVSGSDLSASSTTDHLASLGIKVFIGHRAENIASTDVIVVSTAVANDNPEVLSGREKGISIVPRAMMLAEIMRFKYGVAIAGTHGKTTTTSLCAEVLNQCGLDPTFIIGGKLSSMQSNAKLGTGDYLVAEADESDASFLYLNPLISVVTNIDFDHMDTYDHDEGKLKQTFVDFLHRLPFYGKAILCYEDMRLRSIINLIGRPVITYGFDTSCDIYAKDLRHQDGKMAFTVCVAESNIEYPIELNLPGVHNVLNALAVIAVALECEGKIKDIAIGLANFHGVGRRCQHYPDIITNGVKASLIDDYGHDPTELRATLSALKSAYPNRRLVLLFQPHRNTRTRDLFNDFVAILSNVDLPIILEIYAAGEDPIPHVSGEELVRAVRLYGNERVLYVSSLDEAKQVVFNIIQDNDLVVTMGAGSIGKLPQMLLT